MISVDKFVDDIVTRKVHTNYSNKVHTKIGVDNFNSNQFPIGEYAKQFNYTTPPSLESLMHTKKSAPYNPPVHQTKALHTQPYLYNNLRPNPHAPPSNTPMAPHYMGNFYGIPKGKDFVYMESNVYKPVSTSQYIASNIKDRTVLGTPVSIAEGGASDTGVSNFMSSPEITDIINGSRDKTINIPVRTPRTPLNEGRGVAESKSTNPVIKSTPVSVQPAFPENKTIVGRLKERFSDVKDRIMLKRPEEGKTQTLQEALQQAQQDDEFPIAADLNSLNSNKSKKSTMSDTMRRKLAEDYGLFDYHEEIFHSPLTHTPRKKSLTPVVEFSQEIASEPSALTQKSTRKQSARKIEFANPPLPSEKSRKLSVKEISQNIAEAGFQKYTSDDSMELKKTEQLTTKEKTEVVKRIITQTTKDDDYKYERANDTQIEGIREVKAQVYELINSSDDMTKELRDRVDELMRDQHMMTLWRSNQGKPLSDKSFIASIKYIFDNKIVRRQKPPVIEDDDEISEKIKFPKGHQFTNKDSDASF